MLADAQGKPGSLHSFWLSTGLFYFLLALESAVMRHGSHHGEAQNVHGSSPQVKQVTSGHDSP